MSSRGPVTWPRGKGRGFSLKAARVGVANPAGSSETSAHRQSCLEPSRSSPNALGLGLRFAREPPGLTARLNARRNVKPRGQVLEGPPGSAARGRSEGGASRGHLTLDALGGEVGVFPCVDRPKTRGLLAGIVVMLVVGCTSSAPEPGPTSARHFARYFFAEPSDVGVLEVDAARPSLCYSTQTFPARPIAIVEKDHDRVVFAYAPRRAQYCERRVDVTLARELVAHPGSFVIRWSPIPGDAVVDTRLTGSP
jgi:hypothetical protein